MNNSIEEIIKRAAASVKGQDDAKKLADAFELVAKSLRGDGVSESQKIAAFKASETKRKHDRATRIFTALAGWKPGEADQTLKAAGWARIAGDPTKGGATYTHKALPGHQIKTEGNRFTHLFHDEVKQDKVSTDGLKPYLDKLNGPKTLKPGNL